jgi:hypothetical protein
MFCASRRVFVGMVGLVFLLPGTVLAQRVDRLSSEFSPPGEEFSTFGVVPFEFYRVTVTPKGNNNVLFITVEASGGGVDTALPRIGCTVDGDPCLPQQEVVLEDNARYHTWCKPVEKGERVVSLQLASTDPFEEAFVRDVHVTVDTVRSKTLCREGAFGFSSPPSN